MKFPIWPAAASEIARQTDRLYVGLILLSAFIVVIVVVPILVFLFRYRRGRVVNRSSPELPEMKIELTWTIIPLLIMVGFYVWGAEHYFTIEKPPAHAMEMYVVGKQWMWKVQHPEGNREINELHVPLGQTVKLTMASQDVIHSFFLPAFRIKQDVVPGRFTTEWFRADRVGIYRLFCAEYCGTQHSGMIGRVIVMNPAEYDQWLGHGRPDQNLAQTGEKLYRELGCSGCHSGSTVVRAPPLEGLYGKPVPLNSGEVVTADEAYLRDSILLPAKQIAAGYTNDMPSFQGRITEEQLIQLVAYLKSIGTKP
jgi:cytochrome c oxidase subunit II